jgi:hypothetical protein
MGVMGVYGGDSLGKLASDTKSIGDDLAKFIIAWATGKKLKRTLGRHAADAGGGNSRAFANRYACGLRRSRSWWRVADVKTSRCRIWCVG